MAEPVSAPRVAVIIPARYGSTRFPGKALAPLRGAGGEARTLIRRTWDCARRLSHVAGIWVATDDERIADHVRSFGAEALMTPQSCRNGTERCAAAMAHITQPFDIILNLQGDAPLTPVPAMEGVIDALWADTDAAMATPAVLCSQAMTAHLLADERAGRAGGTTVIFGTDGHALYFSKKVLPFGSAKVHQHIGLYAYRPAALAAYADAAPTALEDAEGLEQLRFLDMGVRVRVVPVDPPGWDCVELNNPGDAPVIEAVLRAQGMA